MENLGIQSSSYMHAPIYIGFWTIWFIAILLQHMEFHPQIIGFQNDFFGLISLQGF